MTIARSAGAVLENHVTLELECLDRLYLNAYVPMLQTGGGTAWFFREVRGNPVPSSALMGPMTRRFVTSLERFARDRGVDLVSFKRGERKDDVTQTYLRRWSGGEGVLYIGKAQERARVLRTQRRVDPATGKRSPELVPGTAMVNAYYIYLVDDDFGPCFIKFCSYFPYNAKLCLNGHEYLKRQLGKRRVAFEALDNGILNCAEPVIMQAVADEISASRIDALFAKWLARLPHPFSREDRARGIRYDLSIIQAECALTQVFDRPLHGRVLFEEIMRENLDIGRPDHVQLIFDRRVIRRTPSRFRTRVITDGVTPSLHVDYKRSRIKQYFKEGRALRTETVINDTDDFGIKRRLINLDDLKEVGFRANRRLLDVQRISHDCPVGVTTFEDLHQPMVIDERRVSALRFGDPRIQAVLAAILAVCLPAHGLQQPPDEGGRGTVPRHRGLRLAPGHLGPATPAPAGPDRAHTVIPPLSADQGRAEGRPCVLPHLPADAHPDTGGRLRRQGAVQGGRVVRTLDDEINKLWEGQPLAA